MKTTKRSKKREITDAEFETMAASYETGDFEHSDAPVYSGSHLDAVGKKRVTVIYDAAATQKVAIIAQNLGLKPSEIYRAALDRYLLENA